jgi:hypothetical protein
MRDYRSMYNRRYLAAFDLPAGKDIVVTIAKVEQGEFEQRQEGAQGKVKRMPLLHFEGKSLPLGLNKVNGKTIASMYGKDVSKWIGKQIALYVTHINSFGGTDCIRIRPQIPSAK